jgi:hypothetical protein
MCADGDGQTNVPICSSQPTTAAETRTLLESLSLIGILAIISTTITTTPKKERESIRKDEKLTPQTHHGGCSSFFENVTVPTDVG